MCTSQRPLRSATAGFGVARQEAFPAQLEPLLRASGYDVQVFNAGISGDKPIIAYCRIGERSSHSWFVLTQLLGYDNVKNYDGSWTEYGSLVGVPVER